MENKKETPKPLSDKELENASGGFGSYAQFDRIRYRCPACGYESVFRTQPSACPQCGGKMTIVDIPFARNR